MEQKSHSQLEAEGHYFTNGKRLDINPYNTWVIEPKPSVKSRRSALSLYYWIINGKPMARILFGGFKLFVVVFLSGRFYMRPFVKKRFCRAG